MNREKGFSLVELIIVIAIMAVLVGVTAPQYIKYVERSRISTDEGNADEILRTIVTALSDESSVDGMSVDGEYIVTWNADGNGGIAGAEGTKLVENAAATLGSDTVKVKSTKYKSSTYTIDVYYAKNVGFHALAEWK